MRQQAMAARWWCRSLRQGGRYRTRYAAAFLRRVAPDRAQALYEYFVERCRQQAINTQNRCFAADMQVELVNDGPVTFWPVYESAFRRGRGITRESTAMYHLRVPRKTEEAIRIVTTSFRWEMLRKTAAPAERVGTVDG